LFVHFQHDAPVKKSQWGLKKSQRTSAQQLYGVDELVTYKSVEDQAAPAAVKQHNLASQYPILVLTVCAKPHGVILILA
jgi:hypothetical protein